MSEALSLSATCFPFNDALRECHWPQFKERFNELAFEKIIQAQGFLANKEGKQSAFEERKIKKLETENSETLLKRFKYYKAVAYAFLISHLFFEKINYFGSKFALGSAPLLVFKVTEERFPSVSFVTPTSLTTCLIITVK